MLSSWLWVALGGAAGSVARYGLQQALNDKFPFGTLLVNVAGCLLIGLLWGWLTHQQSSVARLLLVSGFCGGFTTFSAFAQESIALLQQQRIGLFILYGAFSVAGGLLATFAGFKLTS